MNPAGILRQLDAAGVVGVAAYLLLARVSRQSDGHTLPALLALLSVAWLALWWGQRALRDPPGSSVAPRVLRRVLVWGLLFRVAGLIAVPILEDDWQRYLWDGYVFAETGTPYGQPPLDHFGRQDLAPETARMLDGINNPDLPTIYAPVFQLAFVAGYLTSPGSLLPLKLLLLAAEVLCLWIFVRRGFGMRAGLLWFWCPLLVYESLFNAHPESLGLAALVAAMAGSRQVWTAPLAALAVGARPFALLAVPFLLLRRPVAAWCLFAGVLGALYAPFVAQGGFGLTSLGAMAGGWEFNSSGYALLSLAVGKAAARPLCLALFTAAYLWLLRRFARDPEAGFPGDRAFGCLFLLSPVVNPWYLLWLLPFAVVRPSRWAWTAMIAVSLSYVHGWSLGDPALTSYEHPWWLRPLEYGAIGVALAADLAAGRPSSGRDGVSLPADPSSLPHRSCQG